ncbi:hypothetical protein WJX74_000115 [Apatococcus lobatus]|uniref:Uncharacterized protein n=1 Tax=Apatococcus lobatus TaxID=904363 RepID=A0AAW1QBR1_9CHLO
MAPGDVFGWEQLGRAEFRAGHHQAALEAFERAAAIQPCQVSSILGMRAAAKMELKLVEPAWADIRRACELAPDNPTVLAIKGSMLKKAGKHKWASATLAAAHRGQPGSAAVLRNAGESKIQLREFEGAIKDLERANQLQPNNAFALRSLGIAKGHLGDFEAAAEHLTRACELEGNKQAKSLRHKGFVLHKLGRYKEALADLDAANALLPGHPFTLKARVAVRGALGDKPGATSDAILIHKLKFPKQETRSLRPAKKPKRKGRRRSGSKAVSPSSETSRQQYSGSHVQNSLQSQTQRGQYSQTAAAAAEGSVQFNLKRAEQRGMRAREASQNASSGSSRNQQSGNGHVRSRGIGSQDSAGSSLTEFGNESSHFEDSFGMEWTDSPSDSFANQRSTARSRHSSSSSSSYPSRQEQPQSSQELMGSWGDRDGGRQGEPKSSHSVSQNLAPPARGQSEPAWLDEFSSNDRDELDDMHAGQWQRQSAPSQQGRDWSQQRAVRARTGGLVEGDWDNHGDLRDDSDSVTDPGSYEAGARHLGALLVSDRPAKSAVQSQDLPAATGAKQLGPLLGSESPAEPALQLKRPPPPRRPQAPSAASATLPEQRRHIRRSTHLLPRQPCFCSYQARGLSTSVFW